MSRLFLIGALLVLLVSGCGEDKKPASEQGDGTTLSLQHIVVGPPVYVEGSIWHVRVIDSDGAVVLDRRPADDSVSLSLEPGRYEVESEEFPCNGNCSNLAPSADRCSTEFVVKRAQALTATVRLRPAKGCSIAVAKSVRT